MNRHRIDPRRKVSSGGFTLMELLVVITVIGMLAALSLGGLNMARESARETKTKGLVIRINHFVMVRYRSYQGRRVPLTRAEMEAIVNTGVNSYGWPLASNETWRKYTRRVQLNAMRDLMRMEMPDRWSDVTNPSLYLTSIPALNQRFRQAYASVPSASAAHGPAECLYQIVMSVPGAKTQFNDADIGDYDNDGLREFHDAWGHPIQFIRWPAGFVDYNHLAYQARVYSGDPADASVFPAGRNGGPTLGWPAPSDCQSGNAEGQPDPMDVSRVMPRLIMNPSSGLNYSTYSLTPLVYSAGPDGKYDLNLGKADSSGGAAFSYELNATGDLDPFAPDTNRDPDADGNTLRFVGQPLDTGGPFDNSSADDALGHYDNIHNHVIEAE